MKSRRAKKGKEGRGIGIGGPSHGLSGTHLKANQPQKQFPHARAKGKAKASGKLNPDSSRPALPRCVLSSATLQHERIKQN